MPLNRDNTPNQTNPFGIVPCAPITIDRSFMFHSFFYYSGKFLVLISFFAFFYFHSIICKDGSLLFGTSLFSVIGVVAYQLLCWSGRDYVIRLYLKIAENFVRLILLNGFCVVHIYTTCSYGQI